jgi:hypothetical protein
VKDSKTKGASKAPYDVTDLTDAVRTSFARFNTLTDAALAERLADVSLEAAQTEDALIALTNRVGNYTKVRVCSSVSRSRLLLYLLNPSSLACFAPVHVRICEVQSVVFDGIASAFTIIRCL